MKPLYKVKKITKGAKFHFKPYYDMQPWDRTGRYFLCMESDFQDRPPTANDYLTLGIIDLTADEFIPLTRTNAWNFQQGCMPHWIPGAEGREIIYNDRIGNKFHAIRFNVDTREKKVLPLPIQALSPDGKTAASLNFARWGQWRPGYGYAGVEDPFKGQNQPTQDAVYLMDIQTGENKPLVFLPDVACLTSDNNKRKGAPMWFNHLMFNTDGTRLIGLTRWWCPEAKNEVLQTKVNIDGAVPERRHCMWVINTDGTDLDIVVNDGLVSHAEWRDPDHILAWANSCFAEAPAYRVFNVVNKTNRIIGKDYLMEDGHMSYHKDKQWLLTDTYPDKTYTRTLKLYNIEEDREVTLGRFYAPPDMKGELRCDLHPCWSRDYRQVAIDSIHENGNRQVYVIDVGEL